MSEKVVVLDCHQFDDNRISKHIASVSGEFPLYRLNFNFYLERTAEAPDGSRARIFNVGRLRNPYMNGALFTLSTLLGGYARRAERSLRKDFVQRDDRIIFHVHDPYLLALASKLRKRFPSSMIVYDRHEYFDAWDNHMGSSIPSYFERWFGKNVSEVIFVSRSVERLPKVFEGRRVTIVPNYPLSSLFSKDAVMEKISALDGDDRINLAYFGTLNLNFDRDTGLMFDISEALMRSDPRFNFILAGRIYGQEIRDRIRSMTDEFGERMRYLGEIPIEEVVSQAQGSHFGFLLIRPESPMWSETMPGSSTKVYEYLMAGTIPIVRAIIEDRDRMSGCSLFFGSDSTIQDMLRRITEVAGDKEGMRRMLLECNEIGSDFSWENASKGYLECYERMFRKMRGEG